MSPGQSEMSTFDVDTRSDIYSLGVVLSQRQLVHESVTARAPGRMYLAGKFIRGHRTGVAFAGVITMATLAVLVVSSVMYVGERAARDWETIRTVEGEAPPW